MGNYLFPNRLLAPPRSTYYSDTELDIYKLPTTDKYPIVEELTYKMWKPLALIGMMVNARLSKSGTRSTYQLTIMENGGRLAMHEDRSISRVLRYRGILIKYTSYSLYCYLIRCRNGVYRILTKLKNIISQLLRTSK